MESSTTRADTPPRQMSSESAVQLGRFFEQENISLLRMLSHYVQRANLTQGQDVRAVAHELLSDVVLEAFQNVDRFDPSRQPRAWIRGIANNVVKRRQVEMAKRARREPLMGDLYSAAQGAFNNGEVFDRLILLASQGPEQELEDNEQASDLLALVSTEDRKVLLWGVVLGLDSAALGKKLGIKPGYARVKLHRAINHLRDALDKEDTSQ